MDVMPLSEAKARLSEVAAEVSRTHERVTITRNGVPALVMIAPEDLESLEATIELLSDPEALERVRASEADIERGDLLDEDGVRALLAKRRGA